MNAIVREEKYLAKMKGSSAKVYMALLTFSNFDLKDVFPGIDSLCKLTGLKRGAVKSALKELNDMGLISTIQRNHKARGSLTNIYSFEKFKDLEGGHVEDPQGDHQDDQGGGQRDDQPPGHESEGGEVTEKTPNNTHSVTPSLSIKTTTTVTEEINVPNNIDANVVAIFKEFEVHKNSWPQLIKHPIGRLREAASYTRKTANKNPAGLFTKFLNEGWTSKNDKGEWWLGECERVRMRYKHLKDKKTGELYPIHKRYNVPYVTIQIGSQTHDIKSEQELMKFTYVP